MSDFITDCINGDALLEEVDNYIDGWHESDSKISLNAYLGMTAKEYDLFVQDAKYLSYIVTAHMEGVDIKSIIESQFAMAARSSDINKSARLVTWLNSAGLWSSEKHPQ